MRYGGGSLPEVDRNGRLVVRTRDGEFHEAAPMVYQDGPAGRSYVAARYTVADDSTVGFRLGDYDSSLPLVIDPIVQFSSLFGGTGTSAVTGVSADGAGNLFFTGWTDRTVGHVTGGIQTTSRGGMEVFIGKLDAAHHLVFVTYLGGSGNDKPTGIAVDASGGAVIAGWTTSRDFPTVNALQSTLRGSRDAFVARVNALGTQLVYSTLLGGAGEDSASSVAVDLNGNAYIAGQTYSTDFPVAAGIQSRNGGGADAFLTKLSPAGTLVNSTYFGGSQDEAANAVAVGSNGAVYFAGATQSVDLPVVNAVQTASGGGQDAFVASVDASGSTLLFATYLGGRAGSVGYPEYATGVAVDAGGNVYIAGITTSNNFPTVGAVFRSALGGIDGFVTKMNGRGSQILYSTYLGGSSVDLVSAIAVDSSGKAYVCGATWSQDYPSVQPVGTRSNDYDAFLTALILAAPRSCSVPTSAARRRTAVRRLLWTHRGISISWGKASPMTSR
jgi:hypothetical protein